MQFSQVYRALAVLIVPNKFFSHNILHRIYCKETLVFCHYWICCKQRSLSELAWCARNKRPCELQKSSSPQTGSLSVWNLEFWSQI